MEDPHLWSVEGGGADPTSWGPKATSPHPPLFTLHLAAADTSFRKEPGGGGLVWAWEGGWYHDLSRHRCLLPWCCQGDMMNFDLKCSWLGATLVIQGRHFFFFFLIFRVEGGDMRPGYGCDPHNTQSALRDHKRWICWQKLPFFHLNNFTCVTGRQGRACKTKNNIAELWLSTLNKQCLNFMFARLTSSDPTMTLLEGFCFRF